MPWSPTSTEKFLQCPMRWWLDRQGAVGRVQDTSAMEQGTLFHQAMAEYWSSTPDTPDTNPISEIDHVIVFARDRVIDQEGEALREQGVVCVECVLGGPEEERLRHGRYPGTADLVTENFTGLTVTDYKSKRKMDARFADGELRQTARSWQLRQCAWFVQEKYQKPVTQIRKLLVAFTPALKIWLYTHPVAQEELRDWHKQAEQVWHLMDGVAGVTHKIVPWQNSDACERYGWAWRCPFYEVCWDGQPIVYGDK